MDSLTAGEPEHRYRLLIENLEHLLLGEDNFIANMANACALVVTQLAGIAWTGFYLWDAERRQLVLGPFQGPPAGTRIAEGRGTCGEAVVQGCTQERRDAKGSEIVVPLRQGRTIIGVFSVCSQDPERFSTLDRDYLELFAARLVSHHII